MVHERAGAHASAASVGELCWVDDAGRPQVRGVIPLTRRGRPVVAFTYADAAVAREVAAASVVGLALTEPRSTGRGFAPVLLTGRPRLVEDPTGELFVEDLLTQELRKYPPARVYADSPLLMREHWWYLPRLLVELEVGAVEPLAPRVEPHDHLLVVATGGGPVVRVAGSDHHDGDRTVDVLGDHPPTGAAVLFGQDASFPDLECWSQWRDRGHWDGTELELQERAASRGVGRPPGLRQRWWRQRTLERRCRQALAAASPERNR